MSAMDLVGEVNDLIESLTAGDYLGAWQKAIGLQESALQILQVILGGTSHPAVGSPDVKMAVNALQTRSQVSEARVRATPSPSGGLDPATIMLIIQAVTQILQLIHDWRNPTPTPQPQP